MEEQKQMVIIEEEQIDRLTAIINDLAWEVKANRMGIPYDCENCTLKQHLSKEKAIACDCILSEQLIYE